jgi:subtilisin family serine protease
MLAGDAGNWPTQISPAELIETASLVAVDKPSSAGDAAGETFQTAADLGRVEGVLRRYGRLDPSDRLDIVRFEVPENSMARMGLDRLVGNVDLYLLNRNGRLIASSNRAEDDAEWLSGSLAGGRYYLAIAAVSLRSTGYRLTLDVEPKVPQPVDVIAGVTPAPNRATPPVVSQPPAPLRDVPYFGGFDEWNLNSVAAPEAWAAGYRGQGVLVAVIDTGVDLDHPDLIDSLFINPGEIAGNGIDDDHNGYVDDVSGFDFVSADAWPDDEHGHGTHVAGTVAAGNNGFGATGVAPDAKILPVRVLDASGGGADSGVAAGIRYAAERGAQIINLSLGGKASSGIASAIDYATSLGSLVVAASGNESTTDPSHPARQSAVSTGVLSVGAYDINNRVAGFANGVGASNAVQLDAPGVGVYSTFIGGGYRSLSGTSMASPHVAGMAALLLSANPELTSSALRDLLTGGALGKAIGSDSIGKISAMNSVALAAAGRTVSAAATDSNSAAVPSGSASISFSSSNATANRSVANVRASFELRPMSSRWTMAVGRPMVTRIRRSERSQTPSLGVARAAIFDDLRQEQLRSTTSTELEGDWFAGDEKTHLDRATDAGLDIDLFDRGIDFAWLDSLVS